MKEYVTARRYTLYTQRFNADLQRRLAEELQQKEEELQQAKDIYTQELQNKLTDEFAEKEKKYAVDIEMLHIQLDSLQQENKELARDVAKKPASVEALERRAQEKLNERNAERRKAMEERAAAEKVRQQLEISQRQWDEEKKRQENEARKKLAEDMEELRKQNEIEFKRIQEELQEYYKTESKKVKEELRIEAENTIVALLSKGRRSLTEAQLMIDHIVSPAILPAVQDLGGLRVQSLLLEIRAVAEALADGTLQDGKKELSRYLTKLRPVLLEYQILLYCTPSTQQVMTEVATAEYKSLPGRPVLNALPTSVAAASGFQQSEPEIKQLAPEVSWLIPMLVVYRKIKDADMLLVYLDGWLSYNSPQENEIMLAKLIRYYPIIANDERILAVFKRHIMIT